MRRGELRNCVKRMALKITTENTVKTFRPQNGSLFSIDELNNEVDGWIEPFKVGPVWVICQEKSKEKGLPINELASYFFEIGLYGKVLVVSPQQLPLEWSEGDIQPGITADMVDSGVLMSLQSSLARMKMLEKNPGMEVSPEEFFRLNIATIPREEYTYEPPEIDDIDENTEEFLSKVYSYIANHPLEFSRGVLLEETGILIRAEGHDLQKVLGLLTKMYLQTEEYEKCSVIKSLSQHLD